jgi:hypothetical protein
MDDISQPRRRRLLFCNQCNGDTHHFLHAEQRRIEHDDEENSPYWEETFYRFWTCAGCDTGTLEEAWTSAAMRDTEGEHVYELSYHPPRSGSTLRAKVFRQLPSGLNAIYKEAVAAFNHRLFITCAAGLRALIEGICEDRGIKGRNLEKRIDGLESALPKNIVQSLHGFRFMGNEALHRLTAPNATNLRLAIDVSEDLLNFLYELDYKASLLREATGSRDHEPAT